MASPPSLLGYSGAARIKDLPEYTTASLRRIMVGRRTFEEEFVKKLRETGYAAVPSYGFIPENGKVLVTGDCGWCAAL